MSPTPTQKRYYSPELKLKVVVARLKGMSFPNIQKKFLILNKKQIQIWTQWVKKGESFRLQVKNGQTHSSFFKNRFLFSDKEKNQREKIKKEVKKVCFLILVFILAYI